MQVPLEFIDCPCCGADRPEPWAGEGGYFAVKCASCGLIYVNPRPTSEAITGANRIGEHRTEAGKLSVRTRYRPELVSRYRQRLSPLLSDQIAAGKPIRWLDIGAGYGEVMEAAAAFLPAGSSVTGLEPMRVKLDSARSRGLDIADSSLEEFVGAFEVISLINVFSHIPDFVAFGSHIRRLMAPGAVLLIETGNAGDLQHRAQYPDVLYLPDHLVFAGQPQMHRILGQIGLSVDAVVEERIDTPGFVAKGMIKSLLRHQQLTLTLPYRSLFRSVLYRAGIAQGDAR